MDPARRPFFTADEDDECAFMGTGVSSNSTLAHQNPLSSRPTRGSHRNIQYIGSPVSSPGSGKSYYDPRFEDPRSHFLESCALCKRRLGNHRDIFMYRGDTAFCSEDCRQEQIDMDEAKQNNQNISSLRKKDQGKSSTTSPSKSEDCPFRTGTVAAA